MTNKARLWLAAAVVIVGGGIAGGTQFIGNGCAATNAYACPTPQFPPITTYYVAPAGNDAGISCSNTYTTVQAQNPNTPWCTVDKAASSDMNSIATTYVRGGSYQAFVISNRCRTAYMTFKPYPNEVVNIDGANGGTGDFAGAWQINGTGALASCYLQIGAIGAGFEMTDRVWADNSVNHLKVIGNHIYSKDTDPISDPAADGANLTVSGFADRCTGSCTGQSNFEISWNTIENTAYPCLGVGNDPNACDTADNNVGTGYGYCIQDGYATDTIITHNILRHCWEDAMQMGASGQLTITDNDASDFFGPSGHNDGLQIFNPNSTSGAIIERNRWHGQTGSACIILQSGERHGYIIRNNVCAGTGNGAPANELNQGFNFEGMYDTVFENNTVGNSYNSSVRFNNLTGHPINSGNIIRNNIILSASNGGAVGFSASGISIYSNNVLTEAGTGEAAISNCTNCTTVTPTFINSVGGADMRLTITSSGIDAGLYNSSILVDTENRPRPIDIPSVVDTGSGLFTYTDIGAYERQVDDP